jgi:adenine deaminase
MMNYPGVLQAEPDVLRKLKAFSHIMIDGHAPKLSGNDLSAYAGAGISSGHECTTAAETVLNPFGTHNSVISVE